MIEDAVERFEFIRNHFHANPLRTGLFIQLSILVMGLLPFVSCNQVSLSEVRGKSIANIAGRSETPSNRLASCRKCHSEIVDSYLQTAHYRTSSRASRETILGSFSPGENLLRTGNPSTRFRMIEDHGRFYQIATWIEKGEAKERKEAIDLVIGSGRKGQTYLYWKDGFLFQLPVSYLVEGNQWINSPGFQDGVVNFGRGIPPRCLECHATHFLLEFEENRPVYREGYITGIRCVRCHGSADRHMAYHFENPEEVQARHIVNPARLSRRRELDSCSVCHSGDREVKKSTFAFSPGDDLTDFLGPAIDPRPYPDVHGNQVSLLAQSACFKESSEMTCSTCHDVHQNERDLLEMSRKCQVCHTGNHPTLDAADTGQLMANCIDCHMPLRESRILTIHLRDRIYAPQYRDHRIAIYAEENQ